MGQVRVSAFSVSLDGFGAGVEQSLQQPLGVGGMSLHGWMLGTRTFRQMFGGGGGSTGVDDEFAARSMTGMGAWILGRNMFGPVRGPWPDDSWRGWWGDEPPYHVPVFVLTRHARAPLEMKGGTTFHFVTNGFDAALQRARAAAGDRDVRIGGGVATVRQFLQAREIDEMHLAFAPVLLGGGEAVFQGLDLPALGYQVAERVATEAATHVVFRRRGDRGADSAAAAGESSSA
ncbi:MAG: dihydrofolate reductase family protein [Burkholderiaceae bacterium]|jgi:dihydrofolate reductase|nr:dihydrofolate reductase family protein [Burkholderiaceae bacterium]